MKMIAKRILVVLALTVMCLSLLNAAGRFSKSAAPGAKQPFVNKLNRHQLNVSASLQRQPFLNALTSLSGKVAQFKANAVANPGEIHQKAIERLDEISDGTLAIYWSEENPAPIFIRGRQLQAAPASKGAVSLDEPRDRAFSFLRDNRQLLRIANPSEEFRLLESRRDRYGLPHFRYQQMYQGLEVWGRDVRVHLSRDGSVDGFNGRYIPTPQLLSVAQTAISEAAARMIS